MLKYLISLVYSAAMVTVFYFTTPDAEKIASQDYYFDSTNRKPRYYQQIAVNRTVEAIANGQNRILLVMATGTGKTYTAFQIIHRLWKSGEKEFDEKYG